MSGAGEWDGLGMLEIAALAFGTALLLAALLAKPIEASLRVIRAKRRTSRRRRRKALESEFFEAARRAREPTS